LLFRFAVLVMSGDQQQGTTKTYARRTPGQGPGASNRSVHEVARLSDRDDVDLLMDQSVDEQREPDQPEDRSS
jgi:hypothetical protein